MHTTVSYRFKSGSVTVNQYASFPTASNISDNISSIKNRRVWSTPASTAFTQVFYTNCHLCSSGEWNGVQKRAKATLVAWWCKLWSCCSWWKGTSWRLNSKKNQACSYSYVLSSYAASGSQSYVSDNRTFRVSVMAGLLIRILFMLFSVYNTV